MRLRLLIICFTFYSISTCHAQENVKLEVEKHIKREQIPASILAAIQPLLDQASKIKYYEEKDSSNTFYEIKLKYVSKQLSVKFSDEGDFYDLEETIAFKDLPDTTQKNILNYLTHQFVNFKTKKTQIRYYSPLPQAIELYLSNSFSSFTRNLEVEAFIKLENDSHSGLYEFQFSENGVFLSKRKIITREADYVLY